MKKTRLRKKAKKHTPAWWKIKFWDVFKVYIKQRDCYTCFTCGALNLQGNNAHAGHLYPRQVGGMNLFFNEFAVHCQCYRCNINLGGNGAVYKEKIIQKYGIKMANHLEKLKNKVATFKWGEKEYRYLIALYQSKIC